MVKVQKKIIHTSKNNDILNTMKKLKDPFELFCSSLKHFEHKLKLNFLDVI